MISNFKLSALVCSLACLAPQIALATHGEKKELMICNNFTNKPIWVSISSTPVGGTEKIWKDGLQINPSEECQRIEVPKDYFNAGRAYIFSKKPVITPTYTEYNSNGNFQLVEFTFRDTVGKPGVTDDLDGVGYNYSAVDSVSSAIPLAVEATDTKLSPGYRSFNYTGNLMQREFGEDTRDLDKEFEKLVDAGWPYYPNASSDGHYKIPGGYNALSQDRQNGMWAYKVKGVTPEILTQRWKDWVGDGKTAKINCDISIPQSPKPGDPVYSKEFCKAFQDTARLVWDGFVNNRDNVRKPPKGEFANLYTDVAIAQHITGYAIFNEQDKSTSFADIDERKLGPKWTALAQGIPNEKPDYQQFKFPVYDSPYNLDPYVTAIHKNFKLNVYAFSINDEVGYFDAPTQDVVVIAVGGLRGLPNKTQAKPQHAYFMAYWGPGWEKIKSCNVKNEELIDQTLGGAAPLLFSDSSNLCEVTLSAADAKFTIMVKSENNRLTKVNCNNIKGNICNQINVGKDDERRTMNIPSPAPPKASPTAYWGPGWHHVKSCNADGRDLSPAVGGAEPMLFKSDNACEMKLSAPGEEFTFTIGLENKLLNKGKCENTRNQERCNQVEVHIDTNSVTVPSPLK